MRRFFNYFLLLSTLAIAVVSLLFSSAVQSENKMASLIQSVLPFLLLLNAGLTCYWLLRRSWWFLFPVVAMLSHWNYMAASFQFRGKSQSVTAERVDSATYRICTYNVHSFAYGISKVSVGMIGEYLAKQKVDLLCVQEFDYGKNLSLKDIEKSFATLPHHAYCIQDTGLSMAIFSKYPILNIKRVRYGKDGCRTLFCDVKLGKDTVRLINCHLQTTNFNQTRFKNSPGLWFWNYQEQVYKTKHAIKVVAYNALRRNIQVRFLEKLIHESPYPVLLSGDFNSSPASYAYRSIEKNMTDGFKESGSGYLYTYNYLLHLFRIDFIFHSKGLVGTEYWSDKLDFSDHNPTVMTFGLSPKQLIP
jgi:endonuclease/exonuclease/phosphatase family metal-dependent hydrolase